ncbi:MAG: hypothetical protein L6408_01655, partial [Nanoarchaeota archaeon]|nr:hypothetical protein [Nanoarchaeota archaeon]
MKEYLFILGRDHELSILEIIAYFEKNKLNYSMKDFTVSAAVIAIDGEFDSVISIKQLGGIVKIGEIISDVRDYIYEGTDNKVKFGVSPYEVEDISDIEQEIKSMFKEQKLKGIYKKTKREGGPLMPNEVIKQKLVEEGVEFLVYRNYLAKTLAAFNPFDHEKRDEQMPCKDYLKTISIRLAKILINLSQAKKTLLDPFCGYGVILQEGMLMGLDVKGIDQDKTSIDSAKTNLRFIEKKYNLKVSYKVIHGDSTQLSKIIQNADAIATEPFLGPYIKEMPTIQEAQKIMAKLEPMYDAVIKEAKKVVKGKIAIVVPRFPTIQNVEVVMRFSQIIKKYGYKPWRPIELIGMPVIYPHGRIVREIWVIE